MTRQARFWNQRQRALKWATPITPTTQRGDEPGRGWCRPLLPHLDRGWSPRSRASGLPPPRHDQHPSPSASRPTRHTRGLLQDYPVFHPIRAVELTPARGGLVPGRRQGRRMGETVRFEETLRRLAIIDEGFVEDQAGFGLDPAGPSAPDTKTAALLRAGYAWPPGGRVRLEWSTWRAQPRTRSPTR